MSAWRKNGTGLFVYGTLRVGEFNYCMVESAIVDEPDVNCTTPGNLYFYRSLNSYPVAKFTDSRDEEKIRGDLLWLDAGNIAFEDVQRMEQGAGYEVRKITVTLEDGAQVISYGFHYLHDVDHTLRIQDGDWMRAIHEDEMPGNIEDYVEDDWEPVV